MDEAGAAVGAEVDVEMGAEMGASSSATLSFFVEDVGSSSRLAFFVEDVAEAAWACDAASLAADDDDAAELRLGAAGAPPLPGGGGIGMAGSATRLKRLVCRACPAIDWIVMANVGKLEVLRIPDAVIVEKSHAWQRSAMPSSASRRGAVGKVKVLVAWVDPFVEQARDAR